MPYSVLVVSPDSDTLRAVDACLRDAGCEVRRESGVEGGLAAFHARTPDVLVLDARLYGSDSFDVLAELRARDAGIVVLASERDEPVPGLEPAAVRADRPVDGPSLWAAVSRAGSAARSQRRDRLAHVADPRELLSDWFGVSPGMQDLARRAGRVARHDRATILVTGESGTGKGRLARLIHRMSSRACQPMVEVNCAALDATFLASELFGHEKGAFTDAKAMKPGLFEVAHQGTLFLDEIGDMALGLQPRLLRAVEDRVFRRVGGTRELHADVRLIAATNRDLERMVFAGTFREDLYHRLQVTSLHLPPVRERSREDRLRLIERLLAEVSSGVAGAPVGVHRDALEALLVYAWPGNVRQMRNVLEEALIHASGKEALDWEDLPARVRDIPAGPGAPDDLSLAAVERRHIRHVLGLFGGNRSKAAQALGIARSTLAQKIRQFGLDR